MRATLVLLHGFGGTHRSWDAVRAQMSTARYRAIVAPDLPGHGERGELRPIDFAAAVKVAEAALNRPPAVLVGYSLGGRIAQLVALNRPERVSRLVLVSTTAGIEAARERAERTIADHMLADEIETMTAQRFADRWQSLPLFAATQPTAAALWRADLVRGDPRNLAAALRGLSTGLMEPLWERLGALRMPVTVVVGERDSKFRAIAERMISALPAAELIVIEGAGHGLPREAPAALAAAIERATGVAAVADRDL